MVSNTKPHKHASHARTKKTTITPSTIRTMKKIRTMNLGESVTSVNYLDYSYQNTRETSNYIPGLTYRIPPDLAVSNKSKYTHAICILYCGRTFFPSIWLPILSATNKATKSNIGEPTIFNELESYEEPILDSNVEIQKHNLDFITTNVHIIQQYITQLATDFKNKPPYKGHTHPDNQKYIMIYQLFRFNTISTSKYPNWIISKRISTTSKHDDSKPTYYIINISNPYINYLTNKILPHYFTTFDIDSTLGLGTYSHIDVAIIGGGPVGLCIAYILASCKKFKVTLYEKRTSYVRNQYLAMDTRSISRSIYKPIIKLLHNEGNVCYISFPSTDVKGNCYKEKPPRYSGHLTQIRISEFERLMRSHCIKQGVTCIEKHITHHSDITEPYDILFGCEGGKSVTRDTILKASELDDSRYRSYGMIINYKDNTTTQFVKKTYKQTFNLPGSQFRYRFFRGKDRYAYLGLQLTKSEYSSLQASTSQSTSQSTNQSTNNTITFGDIPDSLKNVLRGYWKLYNAKPSGFKKGESINKVPVVPFQIKHVQYDKYADVVDGKLVVIAGDTISQSHFFTGSGVTNGLDVVENLLIYLVYNFIPKRMVHEFKYLANQYNISTAGHIANYWESTRTGFNPTKLAKPICAKMTKDDWNNIKARTISMTDDGLDPQTVKLDWFDDNDEMCKMFANLVVNEYQHLAQHLA